MMTSGTSSFSTIMLLKFVLVSVFLKVTLTSDISDDDGHQGLVQLARIERPGYWTFIEDKSQPGGVLPYARLGRKVLKLPQTLIPYPRAGRMLLDSEFYDYDESLVPDLYNFIDSPFSDTFLDSRTSGAKRSSRIAFPPRIGRKKRSISEDETGHDEHGSGKKNLDTFERSASEEWSDFEEFEPDVFYRAERKPPSRSRNAFVPRVGRRSNVGLHQTESKRALAFTPRIGRAAFLSRIGRNDPRFQIQSRGAFIPRIGRRAAFTPRIGRSSGQNLNNNE